MYKIQYANIQDESSDILKLREQKILQKSIELMEIASRPDAGLFANTDAIHFTTRLWTAFLEDLTMSENHLTNETKANLISIGIWILKELDKIHAERSYNYHDIIEITKIIKKGLD